MNQSKTLDYDLFEYIIALNSSVNEIYTAAINDELKLEYVGNSNIKSYLKIIFDFYKQHQTLPNSSEVRTYLNSEELKNAYKDVVTKFKTLDTSYNIDELLLNTQQYIREKAVYSAVKTTVNTFTSDNDKNIGDIFNLFDKACNISLIDDLGFDYFNEVDRHINDIKRIDNFIPSGYRWLDKMLGGGFLEGGRALYMFLGGTNVGKSIVLGNIAARLVEQGKTVVLISLEMPEPVYCKRISAQLSRIPFASLKNETDALKEFLTDFRSKNPNARLITKEFPPSSINCNHLTAYLKKIKTKLKIKIDAIVVDYLTLLNSNSPTGSSYEDGKDIAEQLRAMSYPQFFGCPIISAGQINRAGLSEANPELDKTGESIGIPQTADAIFSLWQTEAEKELGILNFGIRKNRFGLNYGKQAFRIDYDTLSIDESEDIFGNSNTQEAANLLESLSK